MTYPIDETTKPSWLNRKLKQRWKKAKIIDLIRSGLTDCYRLAHDCPATNKVARFGTLQNNTVRPMALALVNRFFYAYRKGTGLVRAAYPFMVGRFLGAATVLAAFQPLIIPHRPRFGTLDGGYLAFQYR